MYTNFIVSQRPINNTPWRGFGENLKVKNLDLKKKKSEGKIVC